MMTRSHWSARFGASIFAKLSIWITSECAALTSSLVIRLPLSLMYNSKLNRFASATPSDWLAEMTKMRGLSHCSVSSSMAHFAW